MVSKDLLFTFMMMMKTDLIIFVVHESLVFFSNRLTGCLKLSALFTCVCTYVTSKQNEPVGQVLKHIQIQQSPPIATSFMVDFWL